MRWPYPGNVNNALVVRIVARDEIGCPLRPSRWKRRIIARPAINLQRCRRPNEISPVRSHASRQPFKRPFDVAADLVGLQIDETGRNAGNDVLEGGSSTYENGAFAQLQSEINQNSKQRQ